jgi:hypothetical protein
MPQVELSYWSNNDNNVAEYYKCICVATNKTHITYRHSVNFTLVNSVRSSVVERSLDKAWVAGSNPAGPTILNHYERKTKRTN